MGSALSLTLANVFQYHHKTIWLKSCSKKFRPKYYKRFADGIIMLLKNLRIYNNLLHIWTNNIRFSVDAEKMELSLF